MALVIRGTVPSALDQHVALVHVTGLGAALVAQTGSTSVQRQAQPSEMDMLIGNATPLVAEVHEDLAHVPLGQSG